MTIEQAFAILEQFAMHPDSVVIEAIDSVFLHQAEEKLPSDQWSHFSDLLAGTNEQR